MTWERAALVSKVASRGMVFKKSAKQIAIFRADGQFYAIDNRCPHEGFPLAEGTVDDQCVLTCNWHNWKFRLQDGECLLGGDHVRSYRTEVRGSELWIDLSPPPLDVLQSEILRGLKQANHDRDYGRICREITRLHYNQLDPLQAVIHAIQWSSDRFEFGTTHAYAAAADWLGWYSEFDDWHRQLICLAEPVDHIAFDSQRHRIYEYADGQIDYDEDVLLDAVENEDRPTAETIVRCGVRSGMRWSDLESAFCRAALAHFNDFGHSLIYVLKTGQLIERLGNDVLLPLVLPLARHLCYTTREDLIPEFNRYGQALPAIQEGTTLGEKLPAKLDGAPTRLVLAWVVENYDATNCKLIYDQLLAAIARNLLHFELKFDQTTDGKVNDNVGWLNLTHGITFSNAVRLICDRYPDLWPQGLLQMACMLGRNSHYLDHDLEETLWFVEDEQTFFAKARERTLDHGFRDPIFSAHLVKTIVAVEDELPHASADCQRYLLAGLNRFLHSPIKQKHGMRLAQQAIELVQRDF